MRGKIYEMQRVRAFCSGFSPRTSYQSVNTPRKTTASRVERPSLRKTTLGKFHKHSRTVSTNPAGHGKLNAIHNQGHSFDGYFAHRDMDSKATLRLPSRRPVYPYCLCILKSQYFSSFTIACC